jgi:hemoglobin-like flavoprotein
MTRDHIRLVQDSFAAIEATPDIFAERFYARLAELDPSLRSAFEWALRMRRRQLLDVLRAAVRGLEDFDALEPDLGGLGRSYADDASEPEHYQGIARALLAGLEASLGTPLTPDVRGAWVMAYSMLSSAMWRGATGSSSAAGSKRAA